jgi:peptidoglycan/LPS O-acetylase OafA/YrhL
MVQCEPSVSPERQPPVNSERIPSLDGIRAISIAFVIVAHASATVPASLRNRAVNLFIFCCGRGELGVDIFFCISGFLITGLLMRERQRRGQISLHQFYLRRAFRILPAMYTYLAAIAVLSVMRIAPTSWADLAKAATFTWNYIGGKSWFVGHMWSLSVEEQFYLLWPLTLALFMERKALVIALSIIALSPVIRVTQYALAPAWRGYIPIMLHTRADSLMFGCASALCFNTQKFKHLLDLFDRWRAQVVAVFVLLVVIPIFEARFRGAFMLTFGWTLEGLCIAIALMWSIRHAESTAGRLLNTRVMRAVGVISYSLYLWQQLFLSKDNPTIFAKFPLNLGMVLIAATLSYNLVEQPMLRLRQRLVPARIRRPSGVPILSPG